MMPITPEQYGYLRRINLDINAIPYEALGDPDEPYDYWHDTPEPGRSWVCRDYAVAKSQKLRENGWPPGDMAVILCWTELNEYHAVLGVAIDGATYILDNRYDDPYLMEAPPYPYRWERRQISGTTDFVPVA